MDGIAKCTVDEAAVTLEEVSAMVLMISTGDGTDEENALSALLAEWTLEACATEEIAEVDDLTELIVAVGAMVNGELEASTSLVFDMLINPIL
jgi:hypothetical protein